MLNVHIGCIDLEYVVIKAQWRVMWWGNVIYLFWKIKMF